MATLFAARTQKILRAIVNIDQALSLDGFALAVRPHEAALRAGRVSEVFFALLGPEGLGPISPTLRAQLERSRAGLPAEVMLGIWAPLFAAQGERLDAHIERALARVQVPYLCLFGQPAPREYLTWLQSHLAHVELESWPGLGHFLHLLEPERFCARVRQFVS